MPAAKPVAGLSHAIPPWDMTGKGWIFPIYTRFSETPIPLPDGNYATLEKGGPSDQSGSFHGGVGVVMIVRYDASPVGPYDELLMVPGLFSRKKTGSDKVDYQFSLTRIYVSQDASTFNGRKNWSIAKHRATFEWTPQPNGGTLVEVSHPHDPSSPFFRAVLRNSALTPFSVPCRTSWLHWRLSKWLMSGYTNTLYQLPLDGAHEADEAKVASVKETKQDLDALVGNSNTYKLEPEATGWSRLALIDVAPPAGGKEPLTGFGDGKDFPKFTPAKEGPLKGRGVHLPSFSMVFPLATVVQD
ncbi:hypothetical protein JCM10213_006088 [Rhodosporidiobolus nylandii]